MSFLVPVTPAGPERSLCLAFDLPRDSHRAGDVTIVLLTASGERDTLRGRADRTGEASVCLRDTSALARQRTYVGAELSAPNDLPVHGLSWGEE